MLAAGGFDLGFEVDGTFSRPGLVEGFDPTKRLIKDTKLVFSPIRLAGD